MVAVLDERKMSNTDLTLPFDSLVHFRLEEINVKLQTHFQKSQNYAKSQKLQKLRGRKWVHELFELSLQFTNEYA